MRYYSPAIEPDVVLSCGCVVWGWGAIHLLGSSGEWQDCTTHPDGKGKWGMQKVLREATPYEIYNFQQFGKAAPKRRSSKAPKWVLGMPAEPAGKTSPEPGRQGSSKQARLF